MPKVKLIKKWDRGSRVYLKDSEVDVTPWMEEKLRASGHVSKKDIGKAEKKSTIETAAKKPKSEKR